MKRPNRKDLERWKIKARRVFVVRQDFGPHEQWGRAVALARDVFRVLDPEGWRNP